MYIFHVYLPLCMCVERELEEKINLNDDRGGGGGDNKCCCD